MLIEKCPHCEVVHVQTNVEWFGEDQAGNWRVLRCQNPDCGKFIFACIQGGHGGRGGWIINMYPLVNFQLDANLEISQEIRREFEEAGKDLANGCYCSSMTMSRRVLQRCLKDQGHNEKQLAKQLDSAKKEKTLPTRYHSLADEIREYGNIGAHPDDDQVLNVTKESAERLLEFTRILIHEFYELPVQIKQLEQSRAAAKQQ